MLALKEPDYEQLECIHQKYQTSLTLDLEDPYFFYAFYEKQDNGNYRTIWLWKIHIAYST